MHPADPVPFPGLRPFFERDQDFFAGQDDQIEALYRRLDRNRYVTVMGASGCGKSSLVRAGLVPLLRPAGAGGSDLWTVIVTRPGSDPMGNLVGKLASAKQPFGGDPALIERRLRRSELGLIEVARDAGLDPRQRVIVIVDQFEELFRYRRKNADGKALDDSAFFIKLLLESSGRADSPFYVVTTMRSEYLEDCSIFYGLAEAVNRGVFLLPRMSHVQCEQAIREPLEILGAPISTALVQRLLAETEDRQDGLPLMQHTLRLIWSRWSDGGRQGEIGEHHFDIGGGDPHLPMVNRNLDDHLDCIYEELSDAQKTVARTVFTLLSEWDEKGNETRRTATVQDVMGVSGADLATVRLAIGAFWQEDRGRTFLTAPDLEDGAAALLEPHDAVDLSHECLMRQWRQLRAWMREERENASHFRRLWECCEKEQIEGLSSGAPLATMLEWKERFQPQPAWARRYSLVSDPAAGVRTRNLGVALDFLERSRKSDGWRKLRRRMTGAFTVLLLVLFMVYLVVESKKEASRQAKQAATAQLAALRETQLRAEADHNAKAAQDAAVTAEKNAAQARESFAKAMKLQSELDAKLEESRKQAEDLRKVRDDLQLAAKERDKNYDDLSLQQQKLARANAALGLESHARQLAADKLQRQLTETERAQSEAKRASGVERALRLAQDASSLTNHPLAFKLLEEGFLGITVNPQQDLGSQRAVESLWNALRGQLQNSTVRTEVRFNQSFNRELVAAAYVDDQRVVGLEDHSDDFQVRDPAHRTPTGQIGDSPSYPVSMGNFFRRVLGNALRNTARVTKSAALSSTGVEAVYVTANGHSFFYTAEADAPVRWRPLLIAHSTAAFVAFDRMGMYIVADGSRGSFFITNVKTGKQYKESLSGAQPPPHMAVGGCYDGLWVFAGDPWPSPNRTLFVGFRDVGHLFRYECGDSSPVRSPDASQVTLARRDARPEAATIETLAVSASGLPAVAFSWGEASSHCVWAAKAVQKSGGKYFAPVEERIQCYDAPVVSLSFEPNLGDVMLAVLTLDGTISILDTHGRKELLRLKALASNRATARFDKDGILTVAERTGRVRAIDVRRALDGTSGGSLAAALETVQNMWTAGQDPFTAADVKKMAALANRFAAGYVLTPFDRQRYSVFPTPNSP